MYVPNGVIACCSAFDVQAKLAIAIRPLFNHLIFGPCVNSLFVSSLPPISDLNQI